MQVPPLKQGNDAQSSTSDSQFTPNQPSVQLQEYMFTKSCWKQWMCAVRPERVSASTANNYCVTYSTSASILAWAGCTLINVSLTVDPIIAMYTQAAVTILLILSEHKCMK